MIFCLVHNNHDVIGRLIIHQQLTISVRNDPTGRIFYLLQKSIRVGTLLIVITGDLQGKETYDIDDHYEGGHPTNHILPVI